MEHEYGFSAFRHAVFGTDWLSLCRAEKWIQWVEDENHNPASVRKDRRRENAGEMEHLAVSVSTVLAAALIPERWFRWRS